MDKTFFKLQSQLEPMTIEASITTLAISSGSDSLLECKQKEAEAELALLQCWGGEDPMELEALQGDKKQTDDKDHPPLMEPRKFQRRETKGGNQRLDFILFFKKASKVSLLPMFIRKSEHWRDLKNQKQVFLPPVEGEALLQIPYLVFNSEGSMPLGGVPDGAMSRSIADQNGYEVWRTLTMQMQPSSRQRQSALVAQLSTVCFDTAKMLSEKVTHYEEIIAEYQRISSLKFSEDLRITTLAQAAPSALQVQLHMSLNSETAYAKLREQILAYERSATRWQVSSTLTLPTTTTSAQGQPSDTSGPMDVDRVEKKGKGKKGKDKRCKGDPKGKVNGKGGGKGDATAKPKAKPKAECWHCGKTGPCARDCRSNAKGKGNGKVQQVAQTEDRPCHLLRQAPPRPLAQLYEQFGESACHDPSNENREPSAQSILDTGVDASMALESMREMGAAVGRNTSLPRLMRRPDAQGNAIPTHSPI
ncbi:unnamed protein product [Symbiodinium necroappetens]|uniref:CCHC-type domain-containing protein n=1 Tax=Symbiodinium necroappetens TaxID=1628268 RepID=A0A812MUT7_9DINO|nr:unnamed protein product [Symbiodinium necroappetens]